MNDYLFLQGLALGCSIMHLAMQPHDDINDFTGANSKKPNSFLLGDNNAIISRKRAINMPIY